MLQDIDIPYQFYSADNVPATNTAWVSNCWEATRSLMSVKGYDSIILVIDEIQKIHNWSEVIKKNGTTTLFMPGISKCCCWVVAVFFWKEDCRNL